MNSLIRKPHHTFILLASLLLAPAVGQAQAAKAPPRAPSAAAAAPSDAPASGVQGVINLNTASSAELTRLPGIGESRAKAIVELRTKMNGFKSLEDLLRVKGIGRKSFRKLEPMLRLSGPTTLTEARKVKSASKE
jgi:competence protein ComEA